MRAWWVGLSYPASSKQHYLFHSGAFKLRTWLFSARGEDLRNRIHRCNFDLHRWTGPLFFNVLRSFTCVVSC